MQALDVNAEAARVLAVGPDPHDILGCARGAPLADVKARYKKLCALHPDKAHGNALAAGAFALISAAYHTLIEAAAAGAGAPPGNQAETVPTSNRWQAFTGAWKPQQPAAPVQQQHDQQQQQHQAPQQAQQPFTGSQENTPGGGGAAAGGGAWQASAKWGKFGGVSSSLLRAQAVGTVPAAAAGPVGAEQPAARRQRPVQTEQHTRLCSPPASSAGSSSDSSDSEGDVQHAGGRQSAAGVKPETFYGPAGGSVGKQFSPSLSQAPTASLYGMFAGRRSSGGRASGWLGAGTVAGAAATERCSLGQPPAVAQQPAAAVAGGSKWSSGGLAGGQWGSGGRLADMLKKAPVVALAARAAPGLAAGYGGAAEPPQLEEQEARPAGAAQQRPKRQQQRTVSSSASSSDDESWDDSGDEAAGSQRQPDAESTKELLTAALLRAEAAARLAAHASGANIVRRSREQALQRSKKKRQCKGGTSTSAVSGRAARGKAASGTSKLKQSQLQLTVESKETAAGFA